MNTVQYFDNGGKTFDRYTVIIGQDVFFMSHNALSPQGVNQYAGKLSDLPGAKDDKPIAFYDLPLEVIQATKERIETERSKS